jgi:hypothetical protein
MRSTQRRLSAIGPRLNGLLLANDATLNPPTLIQYFPLSPRLARSLVKEHPYLTSAQLSIQCLLLGQKAPAIHRLQWLCPCSDTDAAVISTHRRKPIQERYAIQWDGRRAIPPCANHFCAALVDYMREVLPITRPVDGGATPRGPPKRPSPRNRRVG